MSSANSFDEMPFGVYLVFNVELLVITSSLTPANFLLLRKWEREREKGRERKKSDYSTTYPFAVIETRRMRARLIGRHFFSVRF